MKTQNKSFKIKMEFQCSENWDEMEVRSNGRFCKSCTKVVVDFTRMTDAQIVEFLTKQKQSFCGRIRDVQLHTQFHLPLKKNVSFFNSALLRYSLAGILTLSATKTFGQTNKKQNIGAYIDNSGLKVASTSKEPIDTLKKYDVKKNAIAQKKFKIIAKDEKGNKTPLPEIILSYKKWSIKVNSQTGKFSIPDSLLNKTISLVSEPFFYQKEIRKKFVPAQLKNNELEIMVNSIELFTVRMGVMYAPQIQDSANKTIDFHRVPLIPQKNENTKLLPPDK